MKSLVTGCAGFIGSHLVDRLLEEGHEVIGLDSFTDYYSRELKESNIRDSLENDNFRFLERDIIEMDLEGLLKDIDYVFHQAAQAGVRHSWGKSFDAYTKNNILATQRILEACKNSRVKRFIYASSSSVYGDSEALPMKETDLLKPISPYGVSKLAGENLCYLYWRNYSVPIITLRYFTVYGPRQRPDMAFHRFIKAIIREEPIEVYGDGNQTRDFTFISDAIEANILAMSSDMDYAVFNIGGGSRVSMNKVIKILGEITGKEALVKYVEKQRGDMRHTYADTSKAREKLGYMPHVDLRKGLKKELDWLREVYFSIR